MHVFDLKREIASEANIIDVVKVTGMNITASGDFYDKQDIRSICLML